MNATERNNSTIWLWASVMFVVFGLCGAGSAVLFFEQFPEPSLPFLYPVPFAFLCWVLFLRKSDVWFAIPLIMLCWYSAYLLAYFVGMIVPVPVDWVRSAIPCAIGGNVGGLGLVFTAQMCFAPLGARKYIAWGAAIGTCSAFFFIPALQQFERNMNAGAVRVPVLAFATWQAAMGTYLYVICSQVVRRNVGEANDDREP